MNSKALLTASVVADVIDMFLVTQIPGLSHVLDFPVFMMHFKAGGWKAAGTLWEAVPMVGCLPVFSFYAWKYHKTGVYGD
jgi:hypothetical protein